MPSLGLAGCQALSSSETHDAVHWSYINLMKLPNVETLIFWYHCDERMSFMMDNDHQT